MMAAFFLAAAAFLFRCTGAFFVCPRLSAFEFSLESHLQIVHPLVCCAQRSEETTVMVSLERAWELVGIQSRLKKRVQGAALIQSLLVAGYRFSEEITWAGLGWLERRS